MNDIASNLNQDKKVLQGTVGSIEKIKNTLLLMQKTLQQASATTDTVNLNFLKDQYNQYIAQIDLIAENATFNGTNIIKPSPYDLKSVLNIDGSTELTIVGKDLSTGTAGLNIAQAENFEALELQQHTYLILSAMSDLDLAKSDFEQSLDRLNLWTSWMQERKEIVKKFKSAKPLGLNHASPELAGVALDDALVSLKYIDKIYTRFDQILNKAANTTESAELDYLEVQFEDLRTYYSDFLKETETFNSKLTSRALSEPLQVEIDADDETKYQIFGRAFDTSSGEGNVSIPAADSLHDRSELAKLKSILRNARKLVNIEREDFRRGKRNLAILKERNLWEKRYIAQGKEEGADNYFSNPNVHAQYAIRMAVMNMDAIHSVVKEMQVTIGTAYKTNDTYAREELFAVYKRQLGLIDDIAADSGFFGSNLIDAAPSDLSVKFASGEYKVSGLSFTASALELSTPSDFGSYEVLQKCYKEAETALKKIQLGARKFKSSQNFLQTMQKSNQLADVGREDFRGPQPNLAQAKSLIYKPKNFDFPTNGSTLDIHRKNTGINSIHRENVIMGHD